MARWQFTQLGGDRKTLVLEGWSAPFGRPRQEPIVHDGIEVRQTSVYYPGNRVPTRHLFGSKLADFELRGRFMDAYGGAGYATEMTEYVKAFVDDQQEVEIAWANVISALGFIDSFTPGRESTAHVQWKMKVLVDADLLMPASKTALPPTVKTFQSHLQDIQNGLQAMMTPRKGESVTTFPPSLDLGIVDFLDSIVAAVNSPFAALANIADQLQQLEKGIIGSLRRARAGVHQLKTAVMKFDNAYQDLRADAAIQSSYASEGTSFGASQTTSAVATIQTLQALDAMDRDLAAAERGAIKGTYSARDGDTWESIAKAKMGSAARADELRQANGEAGPPVPGTVYVIPV